MSGKCIDTACGGSGNTARSAAGAVRNGNSLPNCERKGIDADRVAGKCRHYAGTAADLKIIHPRSGIGHCRQVGDLQPEAGHGRSRTAQSKIDMGPRIRRYGLAQRRGCDRARNIGVIVIGKLQIAVVDGRVGPYPEPDPRVRRPILSSYIVIPSAVVTIGTVHALHRTGPFVFDNCIYRKRAATGFWISGSVIPAGQTVGGIEYYAHGAGS